MLRIVNGQRNSPFWHSGLAILAWGGLCVALTSCTTIDKSDAFPVAGKPLKLAALQALTDRNSEVKPLHVEAQGNTVDAYYVRHPGSTGVVVFFGGSGNQIDAPIKVIGKRTEALGLDLVVFYYYRDGEEVPSVARCRAEAMAVCQTVRQLPVPACRSIFLMGHSLGSWFALDVAATQKVAGLILAGSETTPKEVIRRNYYPWANLISIQPDSDARQLDASLYAPHDHNKTLVFTSNADEEVPTIVGREVFAMLPESTPKHLVVLDGVTHGRYFLSDELWRQVTEFFKLPMASKR